ncbi:probable aspartyl protease At4g16563 [Cicer arietinum]|uniref:Probable aspartyl protease At4g16563 n=1 Tax=Cicer arietinum TaxID=3827 RepID=A0A1S2XTH6_CICAR|nr:probable aspartyl protease At4g16563 [Cicer arietinum]
MAYLHILLTLSLLSLITLSSSNPNTNTITLSLSPIFTKSPSSDLFHSLKKATSSSLKRAHHLKTRKLSKKNSPSSSSTINTQVFAKSYGGYSINLNFGTPPQTLSFVLDTGSSLVWFPCTSHYLCSNCNFANINPTNIPTFIPSKSSSTRIIGCTNKKCGYVFGSNIESRCQGCNPQFQNCNNITCPTYILEYGLGSTAGLLLSENLDFPGYIVPDFLVGCSIFSTEQPSGIAGFGRGAESLPAQMGLTKFSYCLLSHNFDDTPVNSNLVLQTTSTGDGKTSGLNYTTFVQNPSMSNPAFLEYYYVNLRSFLIGGTRVKIPFYLSSPGMDGNGGTIVDSGTTFTFMERPIFDLVARQFELQLANFPRATDIEAASGFNLCFDFTGNNSIPFPELVFQFKGGAEMVLPVDDYFSLVGDGGNVACLTIMTDGNSVPATNTGPAMILGNYQQQNFIIEFDLENERFGFGAHICQSNA